MGGIRTYGQPAKRSLNKALSAAAESSGTPKTNAYTITLAVRRPKRVDKREVDPMKNPRCAYYCTECNEGRRAACKDCLELIFISSLSRTAGIWSGGFFAVALNPLIATFSFG